MEGVQSYVIMVLLIISVASMMIAVRYGLQGVVSGRRMYRMMLTCGVDDATARNPDRLLDIDMRAARKRCRRCPSPEICDRWLNGEAVPGNDFCPNAARFMAAAEARRCWQTSDPARRPGRRLDSC